MGFFWDLMQQSQISEHRERAANLEQRVQRLESDLLQTRRILHDLVMVLEKQFGQDYDRDGQIG